MSQSKKIEYIKQWKRDNPEKLREYARSHYAKHRKKLLARYAKWRAANPEKVTAARKKYVKANPDVYRKRDLKKFGLTLDQWRAMFEAQGKTCAICPTTEAKWHTDHCHTTGKVRGILCNRCNLGLGYFKDNPKTLRAAIKYLVA